MAKNEFTITLDTKKLDKIIHELAEVDDTEISAGYFNSKMHPVHTDTTYPDIAYINNYGVGNIPRRPFMSDAGQDNINYITKVAAFSLRDLLNGKPYEDDLAQIGKIMADNIKNRIADNNYLPNAESYKQYKQSRWGSSEPLVASGNLRDNVEHKVTKKGGGS